MKNESMSSTNAVTPEELLQSLFVSLDRILTLHRQLLENIKMERQALAAADLNAIQDMSMAKQAIIEHIRKAEAERVVIIKTLAPLFLRDPETITLEEIATILDRKNASEATKLRSLHKTLRLLLDQVIQNNTENSELVQKSLEHVGAMKRNILGETVPRSTLYDQTGKRSAGMQGARMISKEA